MGLCISMIAFLRLPSLKVSILLLLGLVVYDVFWVRSHPSLKHFNDLLVHSFTSNPSIILGVFLSVHF
jgi:hypothetical protein